MAKNKNQEKSTNNKTKSRSGSGHLSKKDKVYAMPTNYIMFAICIACATWFGYKGYLETRVHTTYSSEKACIIYHIERNIILQIFLFVIVKCITTFRDL